MSHGRAWPATAAVFIAVLLALDLALRVLEPSFPPAIDWPAANMQAKHDQITELAASGEDIEVAFIGSSVVYSGIDPVAFRDASGGELVGYNASIAGAISIRSWRWWTNEVIVPLIHPETVVIGVSGVDLNNGVQDTFWGPLNRSRGFGRVETSSNMAWTQRVEEFLEEHVALFRLRWVLREPVRVAVHILRDGNTAPVIGPYGGFPQDVTSDTYELTDAAIRGIRDEQLKDFEPEGPNLQELDALIRDLKRMDITVVLLNMPVTEDVVELHPEGSEDYTRYLEALQSLARERGVRFFDRPHNVSSTDFFSDPTHLNPRGADMYSRLLARALVEDMS